jgi:hypothetical protein
VSTGVLLPPPPVDVETGGGGGGDWVALVRARNEIDAHLLVGRLEEASVATRTISDRRSPGAWLFGGAHPWAPVVVLVRRIQLEEARLVLARIFGDASELPPRDAAGLDAGAALRWWIAALALGLLLTATALGQLVARLSVG